jgi:hypothetical protein
MMGAIAEDIDGIARSEQLSALVLGGLPGCTYAVLGSTRSAKIIVRQLGARFGGDASFRFYGDEQGNDQAAWNSFRAGLEENRSNNMEAICATAVGVFEALAMWLSEPPPRSGGL